jgi:nucleoside-diphosphate-sugar epimerase
MNLFVTGGAGYLGSRVVLELLCTGHQVTVWDALVYGGEGLLTLSTLPGFRLVPGDVRETERVKPYLRGMDAVVHLAAIVGEDACRIDEEATLAVNQAATEPLVSAAAANGVRRFIYISTCSNYGVAAPDKLADEDTELRPLSLYARTKVESEKVILGHRSRMTATVLRLGTICGPSGRMRFDLLVSDIARSAVRGSRIELYKPEAWRPFLHIADAARAIGLVIASELSVDRPRVFNVVGENLTKRGIGELVLRYFPDAEVAIVETNPDDRDYRVSGKRFEEEFEFAPKRSVAGAFIEAADAVRNGVFIDPLWPGHSAIPLVSRRSRLIAARA